MRVQFAARALREIKRYGRWWRENRPAARLLFDEELHHAVEQILSAPHLGTTHQAKSGREYRRILMPVTRYHVYYRVVAPDRVLVAAVWSAARGRSPAL